MEERIKESFRKIPKMDILMEEEPVLLLRKTWGYQRVFLAARDTLGEVRRLFREDRPQEAQSLLGEIPSHMEALLKKQDNRNLRRVINATGVILHTNLGRAPLGERVSRAVYQTSLGYASLEYDLEKGGRGDRYGELSRKICRLTGAEAAIVVNNNAAAVLLMLTALCQGREVPVSRGELVEIGGKFRVPQVMEASGAILREVGTTNRTYLEDYQAAIGENTGAILKVHTSNYRILGFVRETSIEELSDLGKRMCIPLLVDLGSGCLSAPKGGDWEITVQEILKKGADLAAFSGDKLLGGPQAGILVGRQELIERIGSHPLMRALRLDKCRVAALEAVLDIYLENKEWEEIPALALLSRGDGQLSAMAQKLKEYLEKGRDRWAEGVQMKVIETKRTPGGGSMPLAAMKSAGLFIRHGKLEPEEAASLLRQSDPPVIARPWERGVLLDMGAILPEDLLPLAEAVEKILENPG